MADVHFQFDLFGGPAVELRPPGPVRGEPSEPEPVPVLRGQLNLLGARFVRLAPVVGQLGAGRFDLAAGEAQRIGREPGVAGALAALATRVTAAPSAQALAEESFDAVFAELETTGTAALADAARRGMQAAVARRLDEAGPASRAGGMLAAQYWLHARKPEKALESVGILLAAAPLCAEAHVLEGNAHLPSGNVERARESYRRALRAAPQDVRMADIDDEDVRALASEAADMELDPPEPWLPFVGIIGGVFAWKQDAFDREPTPADRFAAALGRSRTATARGAPDVEARRELKRLAPALFARLAEERLV